MRISKIVLTALFLSAISVFSAMAQTINVQPGRYEIEIPLTGKVLDLRQEDMRTIQQYYRGDVKNQQWDIISAGGNNYYIRSVDNGSYLGVMGNREGSRVIATNNPRGNTWRFVQLRNGNLMIVHSSGMALDLTNGSRQDGAPIQLWSQARNTHQQFKLDRVYDEATYDRNNSGRGIYNEGYQAGVNDRQANLNQNYRRHRHLYDRNSEREFEQGYAAGYVANRNTDLNRMSRVERRSYDSGYRTGQQDARNRNDSNYRRHRNLFNARQEAFFRQGYEEGYRNSNGNGVDFDLNRLSRFERRAYDNGYNLGRQDARLNYSSNYRRYDNRYTNQMELFFRRGYEAGYSTVRQ